MPNEELPALAEAFEKRRLELGLTIQDIADRSGLTRQGIMPLRQGKLRHYNDRTIFGIRDAFGWRDDWYAAVIDGATADELLADGQAPPSPPPWEELLEAQRQVTIGLEEMRDQLTAVVEALRDQQGH